LILPVGASLPYISDIDVRWIESLLWRYRKRVDANPFPTALGDLITTGSRVRPLFVIPNEQKPLEVPTQLKR